MRQRGVRIAGHPVIRSAPYEAWDDIRNSAFRTRRGSNDKPDFDYTNLGLAFPENDEAEIAYISDQMPHAWEGSDGRPTVIHAHVHYLQTSAAEPVFELQYRFYNNGGTVPSLTTIDTSQGEGQVFTWSTGTICHRQPRGVCEIMAYVSASAVVIDDSTMRKRLGVIGTLMPKAVADAVNHLAQSTRKEERAEMVRVFDRPTPFVLNGLRIAKYAKPQDPTAAIWFKDVFGKNQGGLAVENTVRPHIEGGLRNVKSSEQRLRDIKVLKPNEWLTYVDTATNRYGNVSGAEHQRMLAYFGAYWEAGYSGNRVRGGRLDRSGIRYFVNRAGASRGIYKVRGRRGKPRLIWIITSNTPNYRPRFDFYGVAQRHAKRRGPEIADEHVRRMLKRQGAATVRGARRLAA